MTVPLAFQRPEPQPIELYDHEMVKVLDVLEKLRQRARERSRNYNDFEREIRERLEDIGFVAHVNWHSYAMNKVVQVGSAMPEVTITGRTERHEFDHDRQVHEVVSNVLGLPEEDAGVIRTGDGDVFGPMH